MNNPKFVGVYDTVEKKWYAGIVTTDGRCRVDIHHDIHEEGRFTIHDVEWEHPENPWSSRLHPLGTRHDLRLDYT